MPIIQPIKTFDLAKAKDAKKAHFDAVGDLSGIEVCYDLVLVVTYIGSEGLGIRGINGIELIKTAEAVKEDQWQSKTGLVVKVGPMAGPAFSTEGLGPEINEGDWVGYSIKDGLQVTIRGTSCRLLPYDRIRMKLTDPSLVF